MNLQFINDCAGTDPVLPTTGAEMVNAIYTPSILRNELFIISKHQSFIYPAYLSTNIKMFILNNKSEATKLKIAWSCNFIVIHQKNAGCKKETCKFS